MPAADADGISGLARPHAILGRISVCTRSSQWHGWWYHEVQVGHFKPEPDDPLNEPPEGSLIR
jgi:hypothetical protein